MSPVLEWKTGSGLRAKVREEARYAFPSGLHTSAALVAMGSPIFAILIVLSATLISA